MIEIETENGHHEYLYSIQDVAQVLKLKMPDGRRVGRNLLFKILQYNKILQKNNLLYENWLNFGWGVTHITVKNHKSYLMPTLTEKGISVLKAGIASGRYQIQIEKTIEVTTELPF